AAILTTTDIPITKTKIGSSRVASVIALARSVKNNSAPPAMVATTPMTLHFTHVPFHYLALLSDSLKNLGGLKFSPTEVYMLLGTNRCTTFLHWIGLFYI